MQSEDQLKKTLKEIDKLAKRTHGILQDVLGWNERLQTSIAALRAILDAGESERLQESICVKKHGGDKEPCQGIRLCMRPC